MPGTASSPRGNQQRPRRGQHDAIRAGNGVRIGRDADRRADARLARGALEGFRGRVQIAEP